MDTETNPYSSSPIADSPSAFHRSPPSRKCCVACCVSFLLYAGFTAMLLTSTPVDQRAGAMFVWNIPVLFSTAVAAFWSRRIPSILALVASALQFLIAVLSRHWAIGGDLLGTAMINTPIVVVLITLSVWARPRSLLDGTMDTLQ